MHRALGFNPLTSKEPMIHIMIECCCKETVSALDAVIETVSAMDAVITSCSSAATPALELLRRLF